MHGPFNLPIIPTATKLDRPPLDFGSKQDFLFLLNGNWGEGVFSGVESCFIHDWKGLDQEMVKPIHRPYYLVTQR